MIEALKMQIHCQLFRRATRRALRFGNTLADRLHKLSPGIQFQQGGRVDPRDRWLNHQTFWSLQREADPKLHSAEINALSPNNQFAISAPVLSRLRCPAH